MNSNTLTTTDPQNSTARVAGLRPLRLNWLQRFAERGTHKWLQDLDGGVIRFANLDQGDSTFGRPAVDSLTAEWKIEDADFYSQLATGGSLGMAESYLRGQWQTDDLTKLLSILCRNMHRPSPSSFTAGLTKLMGRIAHVCDSNTKQRSRRHIAAHYDLSNEFFALFLDPTMMYSSAYFERDRASLHDASIAKLNQICRKLELNSADEVLEIGTGWGGFAIHAVQEYGIDLTTTTISAAQVAKARERFVANGIDHRVRLLDVDYRDLDGQYDKMVSIEMVEAVGERFLDTYFRQCGRLLKPGGRFVLQAIVMPESRYASYRKGTDFIQKYIFPGGFLPSVAAMQESVGRTSNLRLSDVEDLSSHYARTLQAWRQRFFERIDEVRELGFDDRFIRMWEYYLCYCEAAFREQAVRVVQIVWDKPQY